jgi:uncharacterized glyoxalase superfamily protein PhnB
MTAKPIPDGYHSLTPYLTVRGAAKAIDFLKRAFGAQITHEPLHRPNGTIMHAEVKIGNSRVMIADESEMARATTSTLYCTFQMWTAFFNRRSKLAVQKLWNRRICSTVTATVESRIHSETVGTLQRIRKMLRQQNWRSAPKPFSKNRSTRRLEEFVLAVQQFDHLGGAQRAIPAKPKPGGISARLGNPVCFSGAWRPRQSQP